MARIFDHCVYIIMHTFPSLVHTNNQKELFVDRTTYVQYILYLRNPCVVMCMLRGALSGTQLVALDR